MIARTQTACTAAMRLPTRPQPPRQHPAWLFASLLLLALSLLLAACGGAGGGGGGGSGSGAPATVTAENLPGSGQNAPPAASSDAQPSSADAARFLTQATFGIKSVAEIDALRAKGYPLWLWEQFNTGTMLHTSYLDQQRLRESGSKATEEMSYEAIWQQWLFGKDQLRARTAFALAEIVVISNIAPDIRPVPQ